MMYDKRIHILQLSETQPGEYRWTEAAKAWAAVERSQKTNLFSKVGIGARNAVIDMHPRALTLHNAIRYQDRHYFLTGINRLSPVHMEVTTAEVTVTNCAAYRYPEGTKHPARKSEFPEGPPVIVRFPAVVTEKYLGYTQEAPMTKIHTTLVLVTPKAVQLAFRDLVSLDGGKKFQVIACHVLDEYKNEYELYREEDA